MLYYSTIFPDTLGLLRKLMEVPELKNFALAGGTSLALQIGHRISYDLDMFGSQPLEIEEILGLLQDISKIEILKQSKNILILDAQGIKLDFVSYRYPLLKEIINIDNLRLISIEDIAAMKLAAIAGRGKKRDFIDVYFLMKHYSLKEMINFYTQKYNDGSEMMVVRSLTYFGDADLDEDLVLLKKADWQVVKTKISTEIKKLYK